MTKTRDTCLTTRENTRLEGDMERSVGGHATEASQMCHEGRNRGNITALEAVYDGCRIKVCCQLPYLLDIEQYELIQNRDRITALEEAYGEYRMKHPP